MIKATLQCFIVLLFLSSCVNQITTDIYHEPQIVISGILGNGNTYFTIEIVKTTPLNDNRKDPINDARIALYSKDSEDNTQLVTDEFTVNNGVYQSAESIKTHTGSSYWIEVNFSDGLCFKSSEEKLLAPIEIDRLEITDNIIRVVFGDPVEMNNQYVVFASFYTGDQLIVNQVVTATDVLFNGNPNAFIEVYENIGDRVTVELSHMEAASYHFFLNVERQSENNEGINEEIGDPGQLFRQPPSQLFGNISSCTSDERVLGNFSVVSFSQANENL